MKKMTKQEVSEARRWAYWTDEDRARVFATIDALEAEVAQARERALEELIGPLERLMAQLSHGTPEWIVARDIKESIASLKSKPAREAMCSCSDPECLLDCQTHGRPAEMASEENGLLPPRRCTSKRCVTYEGRAFHALGCKLAESFGSDPGDRDTP